jgi:Nitrate and nitrite sensing/Histidine kinase-, DNA gyrase B-, and HSP90-like ATPase
MRRNLPTRPKLAALLAVPLLAVAVMAGAGLVASLDAGARAVRVRGLGSFEGALTGLVHELQRERGLSEPAAGADPAALRGAREAVDRAVVAYRDAAVRLDVSDRDRLLHQRLDDGLAALAALDRRRAAVDRRPARGGGSGAAPSYTATIGDLLAVNSEIGLREAGDDGGLLRALAASAAFSRAKELADRERLVAVQAASLGRVDAGQRLRLATMAGRHDLLLDQFNGLAAAGQRLLAAPLLTGPEALRAERLRQAAVGAGGDGGVLDLTAWSAAATARVEGMRGVETALVGEVGRLAGQAEASADRRAALYGAALLLALLLGPLLWLLAPRAAAPAAVAPAASPALAGPAPAGPAAGDGIPGPVAGPGMPGPAPNHLAPGTAAGAGGPVAAPGAAGRWPAPLPSPAAGPAGRDRHGPAAAQPGTAHPGLQPGAAQSGAAHPGAAQPGGPHPPLWPERSREGPRPLPALLDLARRNQELIEQQRELLAEASRNRSDPRMPGRLLQLDRLAGRARRNAYNLIVLAGGEPGRRWKGPTPLTEVAGAAVRDNRDAARVDVRLADDRQVAGDAADDLAGLLAELVDNATAFSEPETRVRVSGQVTGSGYVLEVEDHGLGMTDEELQEVNGRLAGRPVADADLRQRFGTWVAGRLAARHDVKVRLRRSARGGVTALVFLPQRLLVRPREDEGQGAAARDAAPPEPAGAEGGGTAMTRLPARRYLDQSPHEAPAPAPSAGALPQRAPSASLAPDLAAAEAQRHVPGRSGERPPARSPDEVRSMLTRYRSGVERGRADARELPDPGDQPRP